MLYVVPFKSYCLTLHPCIAEGPGGGTLSETKGRSDGEENSGREDWEERQHLECK